MSLHPHHHNYTVKYNHCCRLLLCYCCCCSAGEGEQNPMRILHKKFRNRSWTQAKCFQDTQDKAMKGHFNADLQCSSIRMVHLFVAYLIWGMRQNIHKKKKNARSILALYVCCTITEICVGFSATVVVVVVSGEHVCVRVVGGCAGRINQAYIVNILLIKSI